MDRDTLDDPTEEDLPGAILENAKSCANCRHHRVELRPKPIDTAFDTVVAFEDEDQKFYFCVSKISTFAGKEIGFVPVSCEAHEEPKRTSEDLDALMARANARFKKDEEPK